MSTTGTPESEVERPPAIEFVPEDAVGATGRPVTCEAVPADALVLWEHEQADRYRRALALVVGNKLKIVKVTAGHDNGMEILCEAGLADEPVGLRTQFITRDALVFWAGPRVRLPGLARTLVLRVGTALLMLRVTGDEVAPAIELIQRLDLGD